MSLPPFLDRPLRLQRVSSWSSCSCSSSAASTGFSAFLLDSAEAPLKKVACGSNEQLSYCRVGFSVFLLETAETCCERLAAAALSE